MLISQDRFDLEEFSLGSPLLETPYRTNANDIELEPSLEQLALYLVCDGVEPDVSIRRDRGRTLLLRRKRCCCHC